MNSDTSVIFSYFTAAILGAAGVLLMTGVFLGTAEKSTRMVFGGILIGYAVFRALNVYSKVKAAKLEEKREEMRKQTDKLLNKK